MLSVEILDRDKIAIMPTVGLTVDRYSSNAMGGPVNATINVTGTTEALLELRRWLGYYVVIRNENNTAVWWGKVYECDAPYGSLAVGASLRETFNRIKVLYVYGVATGVAHGETDWLSNDRSIEAYGTKEMRHTAGEATADTATTMAQKLLNHGGAARQELSLGVTRTGTLRCIGLWETYDWTYMANPQGRAVYAGYDNIEQSIGWGTTSADIGFADRAIHRMASGLTSPPNGELVRVSGSSLNNGVHILGGSVGERETLVSTTISFEPGDDILDSASMLGFIRSGTFIEVAGSAGNSRYHLVDSEGRGAISTSTTVTGAILTEAAGPSVTIVQGASVGLVGDVWPEIPGASVTLAGVSRLAFAFSPPAEGLNWPVAEVWLRLRRVGNPGDNIRVTLYTDSPGAPGTLIEYAEVAGTALGESTEWTPFAFTNANTINAGTTYWLVVERTGGNSAINYYAVSLDDSAGTVYSWDGAAWTSRTASMPYEVWSQRSTSNQLADILNDEGQFIAGVDVRVSTDVYRRQYRDGSLTTLNELEGLLAAGTDDGETLLATITEDWRCVVDVAPADTFPLYRLTLDGKLVTYAGAPIEPGLLPVGQWCTVDGLDDEGDLLTPVSPFLISSMEYNAAQNRISDIKPFGVASIWDFDAILQG